jgi:Fe-S-cluster-containing hydrogenase component 2
MKRFLLDLLTCRGCDQSSSACKMDDPIGRDILAWREASEFAVHCRKCRNAPCIASCPFDALDWEHGILERNAVLCVGCRSCSLSCPFGVILPKFTNPKVSIRSIGINITETEASRWIGKCSKGGLRFGEFEHVSQAGIVTVFPWLLARGIPWEPTLS